MALAAAALAAGACSGAALAGVPRVIDGDTIVLAGERVRLEGIDAPEQAQDCFVEGESWPCGREATRALTSRIAGRRVVCTRNGRDRYGRVLGVCRADGEDLNAWMVAEGHALASGGFSPRYAAEERRAERAGKGIWRGEFVAPWQWRADEGR